MEMIKTINTINSTQIDNTKAPTQAETPENNTELKDDGKENSTNVSQTSESDAKGNNTKHIISYLGNGKWIDSKGQAWSRHHDGVSDMEFTDDEYKDRLDIHFMVGYGQMKHIEVK